MFHVRSKLLKRGILSKYALALLLCSALGISGNESRAAQLKLQTNQQMIEDLMKPGDLDIGNTDAVFAAVFEAFPAKAIVYPTESYYYFYFAHKGKNYTGNIRFDAFDQFDGKVHFAYFNEYALWRTPGDPVYKKFGPEDGVDVKQVSKLAYKITFKGKTVDFELPDMSKYKPRPGVVREDETYIGPLWDESGVLMFMVFNKTAKTFLYLLNDEPKMDAYEASEISPRLTIGNRTGFAFYRDKLSDRNILVGVFFGNSQLNNAFDGPFDQLPDNFIEGDSFRDALLSIEPQMKGKIDRYGSLPDGSERFAVTTYYYYDRPDDLKPIINCAEKQTDPQQYYDCFNVKQGDGPSGPPPEAEKKNGPPAIAPK